MEAYDPALILSYDAAMREQVLGCFRILLRAEREGIVLEVRDDDPRLPVWVGYREGGPIASPPDWIRLSGVEPVLLARAVSYWEAHPPTPEERENLIALAVPEGAGN